MFVLLNGSFGIGKTTTADALAATLAGAALFDPEPIGIALQRVARCIGVCVDDFQDLKLWRRLIAWQAKRVHRRARIVLVPMAFTNLAYFEEFAAALAIAAPVTCICLVAPIQVVRTRLAKRARTDGRAVGDWESRRAMACCEVHGSGAFGQPVDATGTTANIVWAIRAHVKGAVLL